MASLLILPKISYAIDVTGWSRFGYLPNEYILNNQGIASNLKTEEKIDLTSNIINLNYFGTKLEDDVRIQNSLPKLNAYISFSKGQELRLKNVGIYKGKALEIRITSLEALSVMIASRENNTALMTFQNGSSSMVKATPEISYFLVDQESGQEINDNVKVMMPIRTTTGWSTYIKAMVIPYNIPLIVSDKGQEKNLLKSKFYGNYSSIAVGGATTNSQVFEMSLLHPLNKRIELGSYISEGFSNNSFSLFDSQSKIISPQEYNKVSVTSIDNESGNLNYIIEQEVPEQELTVYYPEKLELDYSKGTSNLRLSKPTIFSENKVIAANEYNFSNNKVIFPNSFLKKYAGKKVQIKFSSDIDYSDKKTLSYYDTAKQNFKFPLGLKSTSIKNSVSKTEIEVTNNAIVKFPLVLKADGNNKTVDIESSTNNYSENEFITNVSSNFPNDTVIATFKNKVEFNTVGNVSIPITLKSGLLGIKKEILVPAKVIARPVTSAFFENQVWLIDEINRQFSSKGKKIDENLYMADLLNIMSITNRTGADFLNQHIPKNIAALENLEVIDLKDKHLSGRLPDEFGNLTKLKKLSIFGNSFTGEIPKTLSKLENLEFLALDDNKLTGTVPSGLEKLTKLKQVYINKNSLVGILPTFNLGPFTNFDISDTQLTYNDKLAPSFISKTAQYQQTFIPGDNNVSLVSIYNLPIINNGTKIKPFDPNNIGFLKLHAQKNNQEKVALYSGHTFKIINKKSSKIIYDGPANPEIEISIDSDEIYQVVMDNAEKNPNNSTEFEAKLREYKLSEVPKTLSLDLKLGDLEQRQVKISSKDSLSVFDNRLNSKWQLKIKPSELKSKTRTMSGRYFYKSKEGVPVEILAGDTFTTIESGKSEPNAGTIDVSKEWNDKSGLFYKQSTTGNYKDAYTGKLEWQLVDAPTGDSKE
ncbi:leucine-rich repeat domain-containing protein [Enterococcus sp. DIV0212c]|uniref:leucine-rich repeat domain-containing protein n=1 Tax=Enterococcus sp. DIV0212c TaxID=2230867 RepID=UPI0035C85391